MLILGKIPHRDPMLSSLETVIAQNPSLTPVAPNWNRSNDPCYLEITVISRSMLGSRTLVEARGRIATMAILIPPGQIVNAH